MKSLIFVGISLVIVLILLGIKYLGNVAAVVLPCPNEVHQQVLDALFPKLSGTPNYLSVWLSHNYTKEYWEPQFRDWQDKINTIRQWSNKLPDRCVRSQYSEWLDYYQGELDSAREELRTKAQKREMDDYDRREKEQKERIRRYNENSPLPKPPE